MKMQLCGSCYTLVQAEDRDHLCPRCRDPLEPDAIERLEQFVANGTDPTKRGVKLSDAQRAAREVLDKLRST